MLETTGESLDAGDAQLVSQREWIAVQYLHPGLLQFLPDQVLLTSLVVVIAEDRHLGQVQAGELLGQPGRLLCRAVVGQIPSEQEALRRAVHAGESRGECLPRVGA